MAQIVGQLASRPASDVHSLRTLPRWRVVLWLGALSLLVGLLATSYLAYTGSVATLSYNIQRLNAERDVWRMRNEQLRIELAKVQSLTWVEHQAVSRLGMQKAGDLIYLPVQPTGESAQQPNESSARGR